MYPLLLVTSLSLAGTAASANEVPVPHGERLFEHFACVNCHGAGGKAPVREAVPRIDGLAAQEMLVKFMNTTTGNGMSEPEKWKREAFSSETCNAPPSQAELGLIADWLVSQR
ncbi:hypothetical protein THITH_12685 [Thioalkalivibrio paradoxus ARh 1]|uniref:Cytochrome c domain-containing protein n=1 Tax=Thioalkalivibrio paradoxus ARh 1 TaxID=713585 RepID=W0DPN5_9GAMM|nr:hypothetical protein THITH_12685 [Thioalkalivibrio paradoxus ARh 1]